MPGATAFQTVVTLFGTLGASALALFHLRHVRLERPAIGTFNGRDIFVLLVFITYSLLGTRSGWQVYWIVTSTIVMLAAVGVSNLYVQGGMRLRHVAWFTLFLAVYGVVFSLIIPLTPKLAVAFEGRPLNASVGFAMDAYRTDIGLGDLLVYALYTIAAYKWFGRRGVVASFVTVTIFASLIPSMVPLIVEASIRGSLGIVVPAQTFVGPVAFLTYFWLARSGPERSMAQWWASEDAAGRQGGRRPVRRAARAASPSEEARPA